MVCNRRDFFGYSIAALAKISGVNRGTLSEFFSGSRYGFGYDDRLKLIRTFELGPDAEERFLDEKHRSLLRRPLILLDPPASPHPPLDPGQRLLICGAYSGAIREFEAVLSHAATRCDYVLQADAAARIAWALFEQGSYYSALQWVGRGVVFIETLVGADFAQVIDSIQPGSNSTLCPLNEEASHVLGRLLQIQYKAYIESVVYLHRRDLRQRAMQTVEQCILLDRHLQLSAAIGHDLRWQAVLEVSADSPQSAVVARLISECQERFPRGSLGAAYLARDRGIVAWQTDRPRAARDSLFEAIDALSSFADSRALGPTFCVLSNAITEVGADARVARRYALAGAALHPYGFVLQNAKTHIENATRSGLLRDIDDLLSGAKPFENLGPVLSQLTDGSSRALTERLEQNVSRILNAAGHTLLRDYFARPPAG